MCCVCVCVCVCVCLEVVERRETGTILDVFIWFFLLYSVRSVRSLIPR